MKALFIITCLLLSTIMYAQEEVSTNEPLKHFLPRTDAVMSILDHKYWFEGDTLINSLRYTKIYQQKCESDTECGELAYFAAVREDTLGAKIYAIYPCGFQTLWYQPYVCDDEVLLADFNVHQGDEVELQWASFYHHRVTVETVDSILIGNDYRKRIILSEDRGHFGNTYEWPQDVWVEGFGSIAYGLFFPSPEIVIDAGNPPAFLCLYQNNELIYRNPFYDNCFKEAGDVSVPQVIFPKSKIHYSMADEQLYISDTCTYHIYDVRGSLVISGISSFSSIDISQWLSGMYFIVLQNGNTRYTHKLIKQ